MKSFCICGAIGFILGAGLTFLYFSLATLFSVHKKLAMDAKPLTRLTDDDELTGDSQSENAKGVGA
jgi:hypothetical protein